jgi:hypothetical protein
MFNFNNLKHISIVFMILFVGTTSAELDVDSSTSIKDASKFVCTDEEVEMYLSNEGIVDRSKNSKITANDFKDAYLQLKIEEAGKKGGVTDCLGVFSDTFFHEMTKIEEQVSAALDAVGDGLTLDAMSEARKAIEKKIMDSLRNGLCNVSEGIADGSNQIIESTTSNYNDSLSTDDLDFLLKEDSFKSWQLDQVTKKLIDEEGLLKWKNGEVDLEKVKENVNKTFKSERDKAWEDELEKLLGSG